MTHDRTIVETVARALESLDDDSCGLDNCADWYQDKLRQQATAVLAVVMPLIRAQALEEAIKVTEKHFVGIFTGWVGHAPITLEEAETIANECSLLCAADIRSLRGRP
jgi:hypothetical protein